MTGSSSSRPSGRFARTLLALGGAGAAGAAAIVAAAERPAAGPARVCLACATAQAPERRQAAQQNDGQGQPAPDEPRAGEGRRARAFEGDGLPYDFGHPYGRGAVRPDQRSPRPHEWEEVQGFMQRFASRRYVALEQMPEGESKESMKRFWFARFRSLQALQKRDVSAYEQRLAQLRIEDQIFGIVSDFTANADPGGQQLRETLRAQVGQLVDLDLQERQRRVEWLKRELADQTERLEKDQKQRDALVEQRVSRFAEWAGRWAARRRGDAEKHGAAEKQDVKAPAPTPTPDATKVE